MHALLVYSIYIYIYVLVLGMSLIYKHEARGHEGSAYKSATSQKGGVISDLFAEQREAWVNVNWFLAK